MTSKLMAVLGAAVMLSATVSQSWGSLVSSGYPGLNPPNVGPVADDPMYTFNFSEVTSDGTFVTGTLDMSPIGGGVFAATSGSGYVRNTVSGWNDTITLLPNPNTSNYSYAYSQTGFFYFDNLVTPSAANTLDIAGLLFLTSSNGEINIYGNGDSTYTYYQNDGLSDAVTASFSEVATISFSLVPVPLPASVGVGFGMLGGFGALFGMRKRLGRRPRIA